MSGLARRLCLETPGALQSVEFLFGFLALLPEISELVGEVADPVFQVLFALALGTSAVNGS